MQYLPVDVHTCSYVYVHGLYYLYIKKVPCDRVYMTLYILEQMCSQKQQCTIIFLANEKAFEVYITIVLATPLAQQLPCLLPLAENPK